MGQKLKCWKFFNCNEQECPVQRSKELACWLIAGTHCRNEIQGKFLEKIEMCIGCEVFHANIDVEAMEQTLMVVSEQFSEFNRMVQERDRELESISMELAIGLSEVFEALKMISSGNPEISIPETSELELIVKLKHMVNQTAMDLAEIVHLSHEFAMGLAEHFDVLNRVSKGELTARVSGISQVELLNYLKEVTNHTIESVSKEITHRMLTETALRESEERYRAVLETSPDAIMVYDMENKCTYINPAFTTIFGWTSEEVIGKPLNFVPKGNWPETQLMTEKLQAGKSFSRVESRRYTKDGSVLDVSISAAIHVSRDGTSEGSVHILRDITERKRAEEALRKAHDELEQRVEERTAELMILNQQLKREIDERKWTEKELKSSEEKYRSLFNYGPNPLFAVDVESANILDANQSASNTYQYGRNELIGMSFLDLFEPEDAAQLWEELRRHDTDEYIFMTKLRGQRKNRDLFFVNVHASVAKFQELGNRASALSYIIRAVDITRRLQLDAELAQASKMAKLGEMATGIAHELNQPLNVIRVGADFLARMTRRGDKISEEQLLKVSRNMSDQVDRAANIINHLREFGRRSDFKLYPVDINEPIRDAFSMLGQQLRLREIEVNLKLDESLHKVLADKNRLEQIFLNLLTNARDAVEAKAPGTTKKLTITTYEKSSKVVALFSDTGLGMSKEVREKIFEPFFTTKEVGEGTGLGLSISYRLVKDFGGDIEVQSTAEIGTTFKVSFPVCQDEGHTNNNSSSGRGLYDLGM